MEKGARSRRAGALAGLMVIALGSSEATAQGPQPPPPPVTETRPAPVTATPAPTSQAATPPVSGATLPASPPPAQPLPRHRRTSVAQPPQGYSRPYRPRLAPAYTRLPPRYPYKEGTPIPLGYHLEDRPLRGFVIAGYLVTGIPYAIGLMAAAAADFANASGWLLVPFAGPWLAIGQRDYECMGRDLPEEEEDDARCLKDLVIVPLILDGSIQAIGGTFLVLGYALTKEYVVRDDIGAVILPSAVGSGYGVTVLGTM